MHQPEFPESNDFDPSRDAANDPSFDHSDEMLSEDGAIQSCFDEFQDCAYDRGTEQAAALDTVMERLLTNCDQFIGGIDDDQSLKMETSFIQSYLCGIADGLAFHRGLNPLSILNAMASSLREFANDNHITDAQWNFGSLAAFHGEPKYGSDSLPEITKESYENIQEACDAARERVAQTGRREDHLFEDILVVIEPASGGGANTWVGYESADYFLSRRDDLMTAYGMESELTNVWTKRTDIYQAAMPENISPANFFVMDRRIYEQMGLLKTIDGYLHDSSVHDAVENAKDPTHGQLQVVVNQGLVYGAIMVLRNASGMICETINIHVPPSLKRTDQEEMLINDLPEWEIEIEAAPQLYLKACLDILSARNMSHDIMQPTMVELNVCETHRHMCAFLDDEDIGWMTFGAHN